jgi:starvation-inducible DNA-binding protein
VKDNDAEFVAPQAMLRELMLAANMRAAHEVAAKHNDVAATSLLENFIDQAERRAWFLFEASQAER